LCTTVVHNTAHNSSDKIFPHILQTVITAETMDTEGEGAMNIRDNSKNNMLGITVNRPTMPHKTTMKCMPYSDNDNYNTDILPFVVLVDEV